MADPNPDWARDEVLLALDLYVRTQGGRVSRGGPEVRDVSRLLNALPIHEHRPNPLTFRNPASVYMKLMNFRYFDPSFPGEGLRAGSKLDKQIFEEYSGRPKELAQIAASIRELNAKGIAAPKADEEEEEGSPEGRLLFRVHRSRERNSALSRKKKRLVLERDGHLRCEVCGFDFFIRYGERGKEFIECHHTVPLARLGTEIKTRLQDLALLCANCHRMVHNGQEVLTTHELRTILRPNP